MAGKPGKPAPQPGLKVRDEFFEYWNKETEGGRRPFGNIWEILEVLKRDLGRGPDAAGAISERRTPPV